MNTYVNNQEYQELYHKLKQQEKTIAQLVEIIAAANKRIYDLDRRQLGFEHRLLIREHHSLSLTSKAVRSPQAAE
ncbi:hypothetical protein [Thalassobacillus devorans]|uniref:hypothetical protein n=1 Tax=Thalassobacillus devorans TaxID=279813 RepID=UPI00048D2488|nr:hypothetical protein [Thalassobacillus devorans]